MSTGDISKRYRKKEGRKSSFFLLKFMYCYILSAYSRFTVSCFLSSTYTLWLFLYLESMKKPGMIIPFNAIMMIINLQFIFFNILTSFVHTLSSIDFISRNLCWKMISTYVLNDLSHENYYSEPFINETAAGILKEHSFYNSF
jgi:hypothetical protein